MSGYPVFLGASFLAVGCVSIVQAFIKEEPACVSNCHSYSKRCDSQDAYTDIEKTGGSVDMQEIKCPTVKHSILMRLITRIS
jgi:hypothetical protein